MKILTTLFLLFLTISQTHAEDNHADNIKTLIDLKEYDVEIIIFEDAHARYLTSETWAQNTKATEQQLVTTKPRELAENLDKLSLDEIDATRFKTIKPAILSKHYRRINASSEYNVLFYGAWRQAGLEKSKAFEININELESTHTDKSENTLTGTFKLVLSRYLHIYNQLNYQRKITETADSEIIAIDSAASENQIEGFNNDVVPNYVQGGVLSGQCSNCLNDLYPLTSHRRMRSKELHYIDHPLVGMLIQINPVEKTEELLDLKQL